ncbi:MAG: putative transport system ATP-binding protein [Chloroflexota bacterium]|jgi:putative ABC transport system ATP-binding protein|nr:putative transport system ATP-binding protein [Chloroflexota bacterium]
MIQAQGLIKRFGATEALRGVDLTIERGEVLAIMGPSGSGKSTLLHCLAGVLVPDSGSVVFDGGRIDDLSDAKRSELRRTKFGFVFQFGQLIPELSAIENAALPPLLNGVSRAEAESQAGAWFGRLGLSGLEGRRAGELSGGQAQRVAIARAMVIRPRVIFADEPTGSLDSLSGEQVMDLLTASAREEGVAVVLVTHEPRVAAYADREIVVRDGRISSDGGRYTPSIAAAIGPPAVLVVPA